MNCWTNKDSGELPADPKGNTRDLDSVNCWNSAGKVWKKCGKSAGINGNPGKV